MLPSRLRPRAAVHALAGGAGALSGNGAPVLRRSESSRYSPEQNRPIEGLTDSNPA
jgi:hypothetical protein